MKTTLNPDLVIYNKILKGFAHCGFKDLFFKYWKLLEEDHLKPDGYSHAHKMYLYFVKKDPIELEKYPPTTSYQYGGLLSHII